MSNMCGCQSSDWQSEFAAQIAQESEESDKREVEAVNIPDIIDDI